MIKINVKDAGTNALSYLISMIEYPHLVWGETIGIHRDSHQIIVPEYDWYSPFLTWSAVGPLVEKHRISLVRLGRPEYTWAASSTPASGPHERLDGCYGSDSFHIDEDSCFFSDDPILAILRCLVYLSLGPIVEVPEELIEGTSCQS